MSRKIPPLNPLRVFESVARKGSFTKAAEELYVSQSAVSRQIATLEDYLGIKLFVRDQAGVFLTEVGAIYHKQIGPAFETISAATEHLKESSIASPLKIEVYTTFAAKWLIKRLNRFNLRHPHIPVRISTSVAPVNFSKSNADAAIKLCKEGSFEGKGELLFEDVIEPVCSPKLLDPDKSLSQPEDLFSYPLLQSHYRTSDLSDWLTSAGLGLPANLEIIEFPSSLLTYQAAIDQMGITMGQTRLLQEEFKAGTLIRPFNKPLTRQLSYYLIYPEGRIMSSKIQVFQSWLLKEISEDTI